MDSRDPNSALLAKYLGDECAPDEIREVEQWAAADAEHRAHLDGLRRLWSARQAALAWDLEAMWGPVGQAMKGNVVRTDFLRAASLASVPRPRRHGWRLIARAAAVVALAVFGPGVWRTATRSATSVTASSTTWREYKTIRGQRARIELADGTSILLGAASTLRIAPSFGTTTRREVILEGEAFFTVTYSAARPFLVHTANGIAEDLGTRFVVTAYPRDTAMRVVVAEGIVALRGLRDTASAPAPHAILKRGDLGFVNHTGMVTTARQVALEEYLGWTTGQLVFRNMPLSDVIPVLARWYNVDMRIADPALSGRRVSLTTAPDQSLTEVLKVLTVLSDLDVRRTKDAVIIMRTSSSVSPRSGEVRP